MNSETKIRLLQKRIMELEEELGKLENFVANVQIDQDAVDYVHLFKIVKRGGNMHKLWQKYRLMYYPGDY